MKCINLIWIVYIKSELKTAEGDNFFAEYFYGADGFRSGKKVNGVSTGYVYDGMYIVGESVDGVNYTYSRGTDLLGYTSSLGETVYYRTNVHGDVKELVNVFGESLERYEYNAYGAEGEDYNPFRRMFGKKSTHNPFRYTGEYTDSETGLVYLRNRMYDPETGRFISEDPAKDGLNWYAYCECNPINFIDPWGLVRAPGFNDKGEWSSNPDADDFGYESETYKILVSIGEKWTNAISAEEKEYWNKMANDVRVKAREGTPYKYGNDVIKNELEKNAEYAIDYMNEYDNFLGNKATMSPPYIWFVWMTCNDWDYKWNDEWQVPYDNFNGENMNENNRKNWTPWIYYNGQIISADKFGNINLGYVGTKMGFSGILIENSFTMDKDDGPYVKLGIYLAY